MNKIGISIGFVCVGLLAASGAWAQIEEVNLNTLAVKGDDDKIKVLSDDGGYYNNEIKNAPASAFDNDPGTYYDPTDANNSWVGYELPEGKMLTKVQVKGRGDQKGRMTGCIFQGSNDPTFPEDATYTFCQANPPGNWDVYTWYTIPIAPIGKTYKYFRLRSNSLGSGQQGQFCGNVAELEFWGADVPPAPQSLAAPELASVPLRNNRAKFTFAKVPNALTYRIERKFAYEDSFTLVKEIVDFREPADTITFEEPDALKFDTTYQVVAVYSEEIQSISQELLINIDPYVLSGDVIGTVASWTTGWTRDKVFDGDLETGFDGKKLGWVGLDLRERRVVKGVRYCPREGQNKFRMKSGVFQISDDPTFNTGVTDLFQLPDQDPADKTMTEQSFEPKKGRYVRFKPYPEYDCNVNEIEFLGDGSPSGTPGNLTVDWVSRENAIAKLSWTVSPQDVFQKMIVQRATAPGGPWTDIEQLLPNAETTWTDTDAMLGVKYYYRIAYANEIDGVQTPVTASDSVAWRRVQWLERNLSDLTKVRDDVTAFWTMGQYGTEGDVTAAFDNDLGSAASGNSAGGRIGVELEKPYVIDFVRVAPRSEKVERLNDAEVWASTAEEDKLTKGRKIAGPLSGATKNQYITASVDAAFADQPFKAVFLKKDENFFCNVGEFEIYGYDPLQVPHNILIAPEKITISHEGNFMKVSWEAGKNAQSYRVDRRTSPDDEWEQVQTGISKSTFSFVDESAPLGTRYYYRVASERAKQGGVELAWSDTAEGFFGGGEGNGFYAVFTQPYSATAVGPDESDVLTLDNQAASFDRAEVPALAGNQDPFLAVWTANLIVPLEGDYIFKMNHDDGAALWIDDKPVINVRWDGDKSDWPQGTVHLAAGKHPIRVDYVGFGGTGKDILQLKWSCPDQVPEEIIPSSQLESVPVTLPKDWEGERTFNLPKKGHVSFPEEGKIVLQAGGKDIWGDNEGFHFLWKTMKGDFEATMKYEYPKDSFGGNLGCKIILMARNELKVGGTTGTTFYGPAAQATGSKFTYSGVARLRDDAAIQNLGTGWVDGSKVGWLKLTRKGNTFTSWWKNDQGGDWVQIGEPLTGEFNKELFVGPALTTNNDQQDVTVTDLQIREVRNGSVIILK